jgi:hypothetical protein
MSLKETENTTHSHYYIILPMIIIIILLTYVKWNTDRKLTQIKVCSTETSTAREGRQECKSGTGQVGNRSSIGKPFIDKQTKSSLKGCCVKRAGETLNLGRNQLRIMMGLVRGQCHLKTSIEIGDGR